MTPGQLVKAVAIALDVPEETVTQHDRNLVIAGLRTKGGRGPSAPEVTARDAARLLIATLASVRAKDSVETVRAFEEIKFDPPESDAELEAAGMKVPEKPWREKWFDPAILALPPDHNPIDAIAALISDASLPVTDTEEYLKRFAPVVINCETPWINARISHMDHLGSSAVYRRQAVYKKPEKVSSESQYAIMPRHVRYVRIYGIKQERDAYGTAIMLLGRAFRENGLRFKNAKAALIDWFGEKPERGVGHRARTSRRSERAAS